MIENSKEEFIQYPFRIATMDDLSFLLELEKESFEEYKRFKKDMFKRSIQSKNQLVVLIHHDNKPAGSIIVRKYKKQLRITSLAVLTKKRGLHLGSALLNFAIELGKNDGMSIISLEVDANNNKLIRCYEEFGFEQIKVLENYYLPKKNAIKMERVLLQPNKYIVVTDFETNFFDDIENVKQIQSNKYIDKEMYQTKKDIRVFNFCTNYKYQSVGYYVSLLALARNQVAYPSAGLIRDIHNQKVITSIGEEINDIIRNSLKNSQLDEITINSLFGVSDIPEFQKLISNMNHLYQAPLMQYHFIKKDEWILKKIKILPLKDLLDKDTELMKTYAKSYFKDKRFIRSSLKYYEHDMAILINKEEKLPPSDQCALKMFEKAAENMGFYVEYITKKDFARIPEFDALFIRTTTNVNDYTYDFARYAYAEGLVVMDDPWSILRCANKIYLYEALKNAKVKMPKTWVINKKSKAKDILKDLNYPIILKLPDSAFSAGVYKVENLKECSLKLKEMFKRSELIVAQEYMPTDYDWRIGMLNNEPLYACKYYMAKDHWQIVSWENETEKFTEGGYETVRLMDVPPEILAAAVKATAIIGDGLYGVDLKVKGNETYVIEVNDNPSIEHGVEDAIEGNDVYLKIMMSFCSRLENKSKMLRVMY